MAVNKNEETGVIMKIQKHSGCLLIVIGLAMLAFLLSDAIDKRFNLFGSTSNIVGEIAGDKISTQDIDAEFNNLKELYGGNYDDKTLRDEAWKTLIQKKIIETEHAKLGLVTSGEELKDAYLIHTDPFVKNRMGGSEQFDIAQFKNYLETTLRDNDTARRKFLEIIENPLKDMRQGQRYEELVAASVYSNKIDAKYDFNKEARNVGAQVVGLPYTSISDSAIEFDDSDLKSYISKNAKKYEQEESRDIKFVVFNVAPSAKDSMEAKKRVGEVYQRLAEKKSTKEDSILVMKNHTDRPFTGMYLGHGETGLAANIEDLLFSADTGQVIGPILNENSFGVYKVTGFKNDSVAFMRARHILFPFGENSETEAAQAMADIKSGKKSFEELASRNVDNTKNTKGDLGWFKKDGFSDNIPSDVKNKVFASSVGQYFVVKSNKGVHLVQVTGGPTTKTVQFAAYERSISPSGETHKSTSNRASELQYKASSSKESFEDLAQKMNLSWNKGDKISPKNPAIPGLTEIDDIVRWLFSDDTKVGSVSNVIRNNNKYIVAICSVIREEGTPKVDDIREVVTADYIKHKKAEMIAKQIDEALAKSKDAEAVAKALNVTVTQVPALRFNSNEVMNIGAEPKLVGAALGLKAGAITEPIEGTGGVYVVWGVGDVNVGDPMDYDAKLTKEKINQQVSGGLRDNVVNALMENGNIIDKRYKLGY
ncbi:MAG: peptidyl-prolyl cis-trans isomerase [Flavobacteriales bacterium]|nr:peptidyl-prolyl cis-trans isomerase [Flavobacteriales bacterium]